MNEHDDTETPRGSLRDRLPHVEPPPDLARRVQRSLMDRELIVPTSRGTRWLRPQGLVAVAASFLLVGFLIGRNFQPAAATPNGDRFALILYEGQSAPDPQAGNRRQEYGRWLHEISSDDRSFSGEELGPAVATLGQPAVAEAPVGFFIIGADSEAAATSIARSSPHLKYGGAIVVQRIVQ